MQNPGFSTVVEDQGLSVGAKVIICIHIPIILLSITNMMPRYTIFFIAVNALYVSDGFSAHHQELKTIHIASAIQGC